MTRFLVLILFLSACGGADPLPVPDGSLNVPRDASTADAAPADAPPPDAASSDATLTVAQQCADIRRRWNALVAPLARSCDTPADCEVVGAAITRTCNQIPILPGFGDGMLPGDCNGGVVNGAALASVATQVQALETEFTQMCEDITLCTADGIQCIVDCAPNGTPTCVEHTCGMTFGTGCPPGP